MMIIYYIDGLNEIINKFEEVGKNDIPAYIYRRLHQMLFNRVENLDTKKIRLLCDKERYLFALTYDDEYDGICIIDGEDEDEFIEEFMEDLLAD